MSEPIHRKIIILGSGPAGYTAAIYTARANLAPLVITGNEPGGQLMTTTDVENYPGYPKGVTGPDMMEELREQAERFGTEIHYDMGVKVDLSSRPFSIEVDGGETFTCDALIISTGASARYLGLPSEQRLRNKGVTACATCDGHFYADQAVAVVGGGDTAMEEAQYLTRMCKEVHLIHRRDEFRASKIMQKRTLENPKIKVHWNSVVAEVLGEEQVEGVRLESTVGAASEDVAVTGFFLAIGHTPNSKIFEGQLDMDEAGYLKVEPGSTRTKVPGVFAAGDVADHVYRQAVTAAGTGCMAAIDAERWLTEQEG
ncbi:thioredoxin-disulfide reductase [Pseudenhygromyxa sp. WMMC2535]|uniref:thioredoxin-disulfide reductase n=1 Tax=Pseudenhygromyxa sp. WMMC2535 TaxID=2712867 RepID=UPI00155706CA|nr:thioredoxin-disulfide reductase [Pseudenhygromyxa sp. WMMC2535]NVB39147.1 thioredoxin-disulfide reductase [Pseudenhygromyxa sp. WMMC2535]